VTENEQALRVYLIRCWRERAEVPDGDGQWRFAVEFVDGRDGRHGFSDLNDLCRFLQDDLNSQGKPRGGDVS